MDGLAEPNVRVTSLSSAFEDELVMQTNDDATVCKVSAISRGYWRDPYYPLFQQLHGSHQQHNVHKSPEINMGYYARVISIRSILLAFIRKYGGKCNIVNLGCGFDTLPFWLADHNALPAAYVEVDLPLIVVRKMKAIRAFSELARFFPDLPLSPPTSPRRNSSHGHGRPPSVILEATRNPDVIPRSRNTSLKSSEASELSQLSLGSTDKEQSGGNVEFHAPHAPASPSKTGQKPPPLALSTNITTGATGGARTPNAEAMTPLSGSMRHHAVSTIEDVHMRIVCPSESKQGVESSGSFYHLISCDIRSHADLEAKLTSCELDRSLPTLVLSECVLVYLTKEHSDQVLRSLIQCFAHLQFLMFEQCNLSSPFGQIMIENLDKRGWHLLGRAVCDTEKSQTDRLTEVGFETVRLDLMWNVLKELEKLDGQRFNRLEMLDEKILLEQLLTHYALISGCRGLELFDVATALRGVNLKDLLS